MLFCYLGLFAWNARTGYLDTIAERSGLEIVGYVLSPIVWVKDGISDSWDHYFALVGVAEENTRLRKELLQAEAAANQAAEDKAELVRLRKLLQIEALEENPGFGARVIAMRFGPHSVLKTITINKGFLDGAVAGRPVICNGGIVGRVLRSAPNAATVLLLSDPSFRVAVISQESRISCIVTGVASSADLLEVAYVPQNEKIKEGELLVTSGLDGVFPKGIPVGRIKEVVQGGETLFQKIVAEPTASLSSLEEVIVLREAEAGFSSN